MSASNGKLFLQSDLLCFTPQGLEIIKKEVRLEALRESADAIQEMWENGVAPAEYTARLRLVISAETAADERQSAS